MANVLVYFEGGPMDGQSHARQDAPYRIPIQAPAEQAAAYIPMGSAVPVTIEIENHDYFRQGDHEWRDGCITYFWTEDDRDAAAREAEQEYLRDPEWDGTLPTGMLSACPSRP